MLSINTISSNLIIQKSINKSTNKLEHAIECLSSGFKINCAKDNAANFAISTNMTTKINSYMVAEDNALMGLDCLMTAEGTLTQIQDKLIRLRELQTQVNNETYSPKLLKIINTEANAIVDEINRLYNTAEYNGVELFSTSSSTGIVKETEGFISPILQKETSSLKPLAEADDDIDLVDGQYSISSALELAKLSDMTNKGLISEGDEFILANDIDLKDYTSGDGWKPIGTKDYSFKGKFDGNGFKITNLYINRTGETYLGLFGVAIENAEIKNVNIEKGSVTGKSIAGLLLGAVRVNPTVIIDNCHVSGEVKTTERTAAGLVGQMLGEVNNSYAIVNIDAAGDRIGGLIGFLQGSVNNCYSICNIKSNGNYTGGLVGRVNSESSIKNSFANANIISEGTKTGGLAGQLIGTIDNCYSIGKIEANNDVIGGLVGVTEFSGGTSVIKNSFSDVNISAPNSTHVGGIIGGNVSGNLLIQNSYSLGNISAFENVAGIIGLSNSGTSVEIDNCYTTCTINAVGFSAGIFAYLVDNVTLNIKNTRVLSDCTNNDAVFLIRKNSDTSVLSMQNCFYNNEINLNKTLVLDKAGSIITEDLIKDEISNCNSLKPFDYMNIKKISLQIGINSNNSSQIEFTPGLALDGINLLRNIGNKQSNYLNNIDNLLSKLSNKLVEIGSISNRITSVLDEISIQYNNLVSSRSTIRDADIAELSSIYVQQQILQQASITLLATANQNPNIALQLI